jgi:iron complex transport system substrate-binding protein
LTNTSTRRRFIRVQLAATVVGLLATAACAPAAQPSTAATVTAPASTAVVKPTTEAVNANPTPPATGTIRVEHHGGVTEVPRNVQRVVTALGEEDLHAVLALGVVPVLSATWSWETNPFADRIRPVPTKLEHPLDLEVVAGARPDLIIGTDAEDKTYEQLSGIAPTVLIDRYGTTPDDHLRLVGRALGREADAEKVIKDYDARMLNVAAQVKQSKLASIPYGLAFKWVSKGQMRLFGPNSFAGRMLVQLGALGLVDPGQASPESTGRFGEGFSSERLNVLDSTQALFLIVHPQVPPGEAISDLPNWRLLPVASSDSVYEVRRELWYIETALTRMGRLDDIERIVRQIG